MQMAQTINDLQYDLLVQALIRELGEKKAQQLHQEAQNHAKLLYSSSEAKA